jgi:hypothetical protein
MNKRNTIVKISELPMRERRLDPDASKEIFGGCAGWMQLCSKTSDCCQNNGVMWCATELGLGDQCYYPFI